MALMLSNMTQYRAEIAKFTKFADAIEAEDVVKLNRLVKDKRTKGDEFIKTAWGTELIIFAVASKRLNMIEWLVAQGVDCNKRVNLACGRNMTPLEHACEKNLPDVVELLLSIGAIVTETETLMSPLISACLRGNKRIVELLLTKGGVDPSKLIAGEYPILFASQHTDILDLFLANGVDVNTALRQGESGRLIHLAAGQTNVDNIRLLLSKGANMFDHGIHGDLLSPMLKLSMRPEIINIFNYWPLTMLIILLQEIGLYYKFDMESLADFHLFVGDLRILAIIDALA